MVSPPSPGERRRGRRDWVRVLRPLGLLVLFVVVIRGLPAGTRSSAPDLDCHFTEPNAADVVTLERCLEIHPDDVELLMDAGRGYEGAQQWDRAEASYRRALEVDPDDGDAHLRLGEMLLRRGDAAGAGHEGSAALKIQPGSLAARSLIERSQATGSGTAR